eukprot:4791626-Lingulodinium_polyedra.AAC.1
MDAVRAFHQREYNRGRFLVLEIHVRDDADLFGRLVPRAQRWGRLVAALEATKPESDLLMR